MEGPAMESSADKSASDADTNHESVAIAGEVKASAETPAEPVHEPPAVILLGQAKQPEPEPVKVDAAPASEPAKVEAPQASNETPAKAGQGAALVKFVPTAERFEAHKTIDAEPPKAKAAKSGLLAYASYAALLALLLGGGYWASAALLHSAAPDKVAQADATAMKPAPVPAVSAEEADRAALRRMTQQMQDEITTLKASLDSLRGTLAQSQQSSDEIRGLKKSIDALKAGLESNKAETSAALAQLTVKIEHAQRDQAVKLQQALEKVEKAEQKAASLSVPQSAPPTPPVAPKPTVTAAVTPPPKPVTTEPVTPTPAPSVDPQKKAIANWVVRDVYDGIALVEGPNGAAFEVMQGETIPGVGMVKSIEKRGKGWIVVTNKGLVETARE
jgi:hypothetical protein